MSDQLKAILSELNSTDETERLEVKRGSDIDKSILETICAFSNEPNLGGGTLVLGIEEDRQSLFPSYSISGVKNVDKIQKDIASQCASVFNIPIRPKISVATHKEKKVIIISVKELSPQDKPLFIESKGIPNGIYRRIGSTDQSCTEDDLRVFYSSRNQQFDIMIIEDSSLDDISEDAITIYRNYIRNINPNSELLDFSDPDLLYALSAIKKVSNQYKLTYTGLIVFGKKMALRRLMPMSRVDYIRVPGKIWVEDPEDRFESFLDMRGSLLELLPRIVATIADDLPQGFYLPKDSLQAKNKSGLPYKVLREAIVNALIHRSYQVNSPIQIIRYSNRIEIRNAGYSLKSLERMGESGSILRNEHISAIFHETQLAETKGTGIKTMRKLLRSNEMMPPTFESDRIANSFTLRLLLHHFMTEKDLKWLSIFKKFDLNDHQKIALVFIKEIGAIDNLSLRQLTGETNIEASIDLRKLVEYKLLQKKGRSKSTYYTPGVYLSTEIIQRFTQHLAGEFDDLAGEFDDLAGEFDDLAGELKVLDKIKVEFTKIIHPTKVQEQNYQKQFGERRKELLSIFPQNIRSLIFKIDEYKRVPAGLIIRAIRVLCTYRTFTTRELSIILDKDDKYLQEQYIKPMVREGILEFKYPDMINHPRQAYSTVNL